jgi:GNAT superfamily N-acetyltransferase
MPAQEHPSDAGTAADGADPDVVREQVSLNDGTTVLVRSVGPGDAEALRRGYRQLSATSAYQRFFTVFPDLSPQQVRYFTAVDHHDHEALGAVAERGDPVGIARYIRDDPRDPGSAEMAIVVVDTWQGRGVGQQLLRVLCRRARQEGVTTLRAEFLSENPALPACCATSEACTSAPPKPPPPRSWTSPPIRTPTPSPPAPASSPPPMAAAHDSAAG